MISLNGLSIYVRLEDFPPFSSFVRIAIAHFEAIMLPPVHQTLNGRLVPLQAAIGHVTLFKERTLLQPAFQSGLRFCKGKDQNCLFSLYSVCFLLFHEALCLVSLSSSSKLGSSTNSN